MRIKTAAEKIQEYETLREQAHNKIEAMDRKQLTRFLSRYQNPAKPEGEQK